MRFAYIDSQGKEVGIPSVEALQLRIELGAIGESTMFFDASADKWAAAGEHEIFRTLTRELREREEGTFVAPPPPAPESPKPEPPKSEPPEPTAPRKKERAPNPFDREEGHAAEDAPAEGVLAEEEAAEEETAPADAGSTFDFEGFGSFDLVEDPPSEDEDTGEAPDASAVSGAGDAPASEDAPGGFDFGEFGTLEVEGGLVEEEEDEEDEDRGEWGGASSSGLVLEETFADQHDAPSSVSGGDMDLEAPLSEYALDGPPSWTEEGDVEESAAEAGSGGGGGEDTGHGDDTGDAEYGGAGKGGSGAAGDPDDGDGPRRPPRARPARPEGIQRSRRKSSGVGGMLVGLGALAVLGGAGWFGWNALRGGSSEPVVVEEPPVVIPAIDPALEPRMRELGHEAYAAFLDSVRVLGLAAGLPEEPDPAWLSGSYLGNASRYGDVEAYWTGLQELVAELRASEEGIFVQALDPLLERPELEEGERRQIRERAVAGFQAAARDRRQVYGQFETLSEVALDLHEFLVGNEEFIEYTPAAGGLSRDPVVEAVPNSPELGDEMWSRVGRIPDALDDLGALDKVSTQRLLDLLVQKLDATPIR